jgi:hypothetical protein
MTAEILTLVPKKKIYGPIAAAVAIVLGGPLAAAYIAIRNSINFRMTIKRPIVWIIAIFLILSFTYINLIYPIPRHFPLYYFVINLVLNAFIQYSISKDKLQAYHESGGKLNSVWKGLALGMISMILTFFLVAFGVFLHDVIYVYVFQNEYPRITPLH